MAITCDICKKPGDAVFVFTEHYAPPNHRVHPDCIRQWMQFDPHGRANQECPVCLEGHQIQQIDGKSLEDYLGPVENEDPEPEMDETAEEEGSSSSVKEDVSMDEGKKNNP